MKIEDEIISVINSDITINEMQNSLRNMSKRRRGENRNLVYLVNTMLDTFYLPYRYEDSLRIYKNYEISERNYNLLATIQKSSKCVIFNAICAEIIWNHTHKIEYAEKSIFSYKKLLDNCDDDSSYNIFTISICRIYSRCNIEKFPYRQLFDNLIAYIKSRYSVPNYCNAILLYGLSKCGLYLNEIKDVYNEIIEFYENTKDFNRAINYIEDLLKLSCISKTDKQLLKVRIAENYEKQADMLDWNKSGNAHTIIHLIQNSMKWWNDSKNSRAKNERKRLAKRIEPVKKLSMTTLQTIKSKGIDISDWINQTQDFIKNATFESVILRFVNLIKLESYESMEEQTKNENFLFSDFWGTNIIDKSGRIKCKIPSISNANADEKLAILEHKAQEKYNMLIEFAARYLYYAKERFDFNKENLNYIFEDNVFVQSDRRDTFINGIIAGFNHDFSTSLHLLIPQIEHCVRCLAEECGAVVFKTDSDGVEESLSLESILKLPEVEETLDETLLFNLKVFFTSPYGYGMRNEICHGLLSDEELISNNSLAVWWFTLYLCCIFSPKHQQYRAKYLQNIKNCQ